MSTLTPEEYARRLEAVRYARATAALEGIRPSEHGLDQERRFLAGEITASEAVEETRRHYGLPDLPEPERR